MDFEQLIKLVTCVSLKLCLHEFILEYTHSSAHKKVLVRKTKWNTKYPKKRSSIICSRTIIIIQFYFILIL